MAKAEMIIKVVMAPHDSPTFYIEDYLKLVGDDDGIAGLQKVLDMKGLKKSEQVSNKQIQPCGSASNSFSAVVKSCRQSGA